MLREAGYEVVDFGAEKMTLTMITLISLFHWPGPWQRENSFAVWQCAAAVSGASICANKIKAFARR